MNPLRPVSAALLGILCAIWGSQAIAEEPHAHEHGAGDPALSALYPQGNLPKASAHEGRAISYFNTPNRDGTPIAHGDPTEIGAVQLDLPAASDVLIQFTSGVAAETGKGCPCSVRISLRVDDQPLLVVKRLNVGTPAAQAVDKYEHDRQPADGSAVIPLTKGRHRISLVYHQVDGSSDNLEAYYVNLQAIPFPR